MWPFSPRNRQQTPSHAPEFTAVNTPPPPPAELSAQLSQLTSDDAGLRLEWAEILDKINRWASRQAARDRRRAGSQLDGLEIAEDAPGATNGGGDGVEVDPVAIGAQRAFLKAQLRARIQPRGGKR
jgi:hypothetical protein